MFSFIIPNEPYHQHSDPTAIIYVITFLGKINFKEIEIYV